jgi:hypothetical protein
LAPTTNTPPQIQTALDHLRQSLLAAEGVEMDPLTARWPDIEKAVIKLLGGAFDARSQAHQNLAFMVASALAERLRRDLGAFWFRNRSAPQGATLGFPPGVVVFSPFGAALQALGRAKLSMLDDAANELRTVLAQARAKAPAGSGELGPEDYQRLFDPGFIQFVRLEPAGLEAMLAATPLALARELDDAFGRMSRQVPAEVREPLRQQIGNALKQLDAAKPMAEQVARAQQLTELIALLKAGGDGSGFAPVELWEDVLVPLLHIGAAASFPAVGDDEREAWKGAPEPVLVYVDALPFQVPAADEDGLLGVFPPDDVGPPHPAFGGGEGRLARIALASLRAPLARFDAAAVRASVDSFRLHVEAATGTPTPPSERPPGEPGLFDVALALLGDLARLAAATDEKQGILCLRYATESEAASEPLLDELRRALNGPRIIMP